MGLPPSTEEMPEPILAYLIVNKETGVTESWTGVLFYAKQNADLFRDLLLGKKPENPWEKDAQAAQKKPDRNFN